MKLITLTPSYYGPDRAHPQHIQASEFMRSQQAQQALKKAGITSYYHEYLNGCSMLGLARNLLVAEALAMKADYILFTDDDIWWRMEDVVAALKSKLPVVGFPCFHKPKESGQINFAFNYDVFPTEPILIDREWRHVLSIGAGVMLVKAEVFYALQRRRPKFTCPAFEKVVSMDLDRFFYDYFPIGVRQVYGIDTYCGEDVSFCLEAEAAGYPVMMYGSSVTIHARGTFGAVCDYAQIRADVRNGKRSADGLWANAGGNVFQGA